MPLRSQTRVAIELVSKEMVDIMVEPRLVARVLVSTRAVSSAWMSDFAQPLLSRVTQAVAGSTWATPSFIAGAS
jgi:hypothetical protein